MFKLLRNKCLTLAAWKIIEPIFNVQQLFAFDLTLVEQLSAASDKLPPGVVVTVFRWPSEFNADQICAVLSQAGMAQGVVRQRLQRGDLLALAVAGDELVAYTWTTFAQAWVSEARRLLRLGNDTAAQYDTLVMPRWRSKELQYGVTLPVLRYLAKLGYRQTLAWVNARNARSIRNQLSQGKRRIATIISIPLIRLTRLRAVVKDANFTLERFGDEPTSEFSGTATTTAPQP